MVKEKTYRASFRATFEDVLMVQERLRKKLDELIASNRPLRDADERAEFFNLLARSTLGLGIEREFVVMCEHDKRSERFTLGSAEAGARLLAYMETNERTFQCKIPCTSVTFSATVPISSLWQILLNNLFEIWPYSLTQATRISAERIPYEPSSGDAV